MNKISNILLFTIMLNTYAGASNSDTLIAVTKKAFEAGRKEASLIHDDKVAKKTTTLQIGTCEAFKDNQSLNGYCEFDYLGDIDSGLTFKVIRKTLYNGEEFIVLNARCETYNLLGKPHVFGSLLINFNESETTDRKKVIQIWKIEGGKLYHLKNIMFKKDLVFTDIRVDAAKSILLKDDKGKFWKSFL